jgi:hypothetical protein
MGAWLLDGVACLWLLKEGGMMDADVLYLHDILWAVKRILESIERIEAALSEGE